MWYYNIQQEILNLKGPTPGVFFCDFFFNQKKCFLWGNLQNNWVMNEGQEFKKIG